MKLFLVAFLVSLTVFQNEAQAKYDPKSSSKNKKTMPYQPQNKHKSKVNNYYKPFTQHKIQPKYYPKPIYKHKSIFPNYYKVTPFRHRTILFFPFYNFMTPQFLIIPNQEQVIINSYNFNSIEKNEVFNNDKNALLFASASPNNKDLAIATNNGNIQIWDTKNKKPIKIIDSHKFVVNTVTYSSDGNYLASGSMDKTVKIFETATYKEIKNFTFPEIISSIAYSPDGKYLSVACDDNSVSIFNTKDFSLKTKIEKPFFYISSTVFSKDSKYLAIGSHGEKIYLFDTDNFDVKAEIKHEQKSVKSLVFANNNDSFFTGGEDGTIKEWRVKDGKNLRTLSNHSNMILSLDINEKNSILVAGSSFEQEYIYFWDLNTSTVIRKLKSNNKDINCLIFSKDKPNLFILDGGGSLTFTN